MILHTLAVNPFLLKVQRELMGILILQQKTCAAAYAYEVCVPRRPRRHKETERSGKGKVKLSLYQAMEAHRVVGR
jgi:hypothetical protein